MEDFEQQKNQPQLYKFKDGNFSFWKALVDDRKGVVFRVREDTTPGKRSIEKGIPRGVPIVPSDEKDINSWLETHPDYDIIED